MRVICHGDLRRFFPEPIELAVNSAYEAMQALVAQHPALRRTPGNALRPVRIVGHDTQDTFYNPTSASELHVVPMFSGSIFGNSFGQIIVGTLLIVGSFYAPGLVAPFLFSLGASFVLGGLMSLLAPSPKLNTQNAEQEQSKYFGPPSNTTKIGTRIPLLYGEMKAYGHILSYDVSTYNDQKPVTPVEDPPPASSPATEPQPTSYGWVEYGSN